MCVSHVLDFFCVINFDYLVKIMSARHVGRCL
jgi:hypothetical protein